MRPLFTCLFLCLFFSVATAQTTAKKKTTPKKLATTAKKKVTPAQKPVATRPVPARVEAVAPGPVASTLTFPSTDPDNAEAMDETKKQRLYDELHGIKNKPNTPDMGRNKRRSADEVATRADGREAVNASNEAGTYIGVRVGGNYNGFLERLRVPNGVGGFTDLTPDPIYGFHAGVVFQFGRGKVAFQPEINFQQDYMKSGTSTITASSLVVPLLAKFQFGQQGATRFFTNIGPYGAYSLDSSNSESVVVYGGALGLGVGIPVGSGKFTIEARGYYPLGTTAAGSEFGNIPGKPILGQLSLGYLFPLGSR